MKIFLDCSDPELIQHAMETNLIDGVTTNPSLMLKAGRNPRDVIQEISDLFSWDASISAEVMGDNAEEMLEAANEYYSIAPNVTIKLPCTREGLIACSDLSADGISTNVTLIFSVAQAILAAKAGASMMSPFVGRLNDNSFSGISLVQAISRVYRMHDVETEILAASVREVHHVARCFDAGADIVTMPYEVFNKMYKHILTDKGLERFENDWAKLQEELHVDE